MESNLKILIVVLVVVAFALATFFFIRAAYQFVLMLRHFRSGRHEFAANLLPFLVPFLPHVFSVQGNIHRRAFLFNLLWSLCCIAIIGAVYIKFEIGHAQ